MLNSCSTETLISYLCINKTVSFCFLLFHLFTSRYYRAFFCFCFFLFLFSHPLRSNFCCQTRATENQFGLGVTAASARVLTINAEMKYNFREWLDPNVVCGVPSSHHYSKMNCILLLVYTSSFIFAFTGAEFTFTIKVLDFTKPNSGCRQQRRGLSSCYTDLAHFCLREQRSDTSIDPLDCHYGSGSRLASVDTIIIESTLDWSVSSRLLNSMVSS